MPRFINLHAFEDSDSDSEDSLLNLSSNEEPVLVYRSPIDLDSTFDNITTVSELIDVKTALEELKLQETLVDDKELSLEEAENPDQLIHNISTICK